MPVNSRLYIVHCVDTEGPLTETISATFQRIASVFGSHLSPSYETLVKLQNCELNLQGQEKAIARMVAPKLLSYNTNWEIIKNMLDDLLSDKFRRQLVDDSDNGWIYSWHCMDHMGYQENPRHKDVGYGNVFRFYRNILKESESRQDELNWHFHPMAISNNPLHGATSYTNSYSTLNEILCRRILEDGWFPVVSRPGFHAERPDSHAFLEQWIPFDYANQAYDEEGDQPDVDKGRFGDWRRAPYSWRGYHPHHDDYQRIGSCRRTIFRCLNVGTRLRTLRINHMRQAFAEARESGSAILAFSDHDYRDIRNDVNDVREMLARIRLEFPDVFIQFAGAEHAARAICGGFSEPELKLSLARLGNCLVVRCLQGEIFGPQPFLALKTSEGRVFHDNLDVQEPGRLWTYELDEQTFPPAVLQVAGVGSAGRYGGFHVARLEIMQ